MVSKQSEKALASELIAGKASKLVRFFSSELVQFVCPSQMTVGQEFMVRLSIQTDINLLGEFEYDRDLKITMKPNIKAIVSGRSFNIKSSSEPVQSVNEGRLTWDWTLVPLKSGDLSVELHVDLCMEGSFGQVTHTMWVDERVINACNSMFNEGPLLFSTSLKPVI